MEVVGKKGEEEIVDTNLVSEVKLHLVVKHLSSFGMKVLREIVVSVWRKKKLLIVGELVEMG